MRDLTLQWLSPWSSPIVAPHPVFSRIHTAALSPSPPYGSMGTLYPQTGTKAELLCTTHFHTPTLHVHIHTYTYLSYHCLLWERGQYDFPTSTTQYRMRINRKTSVPCNVCSGLHKHIYECKSDAQLYEAVLEKMTSHLTKARHVPLAFTPYPISQTGGINGYG